MKKLRLLIACLLPVLAAVPAAAQTSSPAALTAALKKTVGRYTRTEERIRVLVGRRLDPQPLPATLPNPFYRGVEPTELAAPEPGPVEVAPTTPDISDADTLARVASTLRITGLVILNGQPHLTINSVMCKAGDIIPIPGKDNPLFIQVRKVAPDSVTLALNDAELTMPLKR